MDDRDKYAPIIGRVQFGPVYHCWVCGVVVPRLARWSEWVPGPTLLDDYADHVGYLDLPAACREAHHPARVAVVGTGVTPVDWPTGQPATERIAAIQKAIGLLAAELERRREQPAGFDRALTLALRLYGQVVTPDAGAQEIRALSLAGA